MAMDVLTQERRFHHRRLLLIQKDQSEWRPDKDTFGPMDIGTFAATVGDGRKVVGCGLRAGAHVGKRHGGNYAVAGGTSNAAAGAN